MLILHTSDWHLGRQFYNQSLLEDQRAIMEQICSIVSERSVDVVIVAGDMYDRSVPPAAAVELLDETIDRVCHEMQVPMIMIAGNHDSSERLAFGSRQMTGAGLYIVGRLWQQPREIILEDSDGLQVSFYPIPYVDPATVRYEHNVAVTSHHEAMSHLIGMISDRMTPSRPTVVIAHCFLLGGEGSESERPLSLGGVEYVDPALFAPFDYAALGHLHGAQSRNGGTVCYSGSPLKYSFSEERQKKSVSLIELSVDQTPRIEKIPLIPIRNMRTVEGSLEDIIAQGRSDQHSDDYLQVRLTDTHAILDVMNKLRAVYPNILHLERPGLIQQRPLMHSREQLQRGELAMFEDFFQQTTGSDMTPEQAEVIKREIEQLHRQGA